MRTETTNSKTVAINGIYGALLGDAFGVPHEFKNAADIPARGLEMIMPSEYQKSYPGIPYGTFSDDGAQLLCLLDSLESTKGQLDTSDFAARLVQWYAMGYHQAGGKVFDCGIQARKAIDRIQNGGLVELPDDPDVRSNGNGALMRCLPVALAPSLWGTPPGDVITMAMAQSRVTHAHPIAQICCALYCEIARLVLIGEHVDHWLDLAESAAKSLRKHPAYSEQYRDALNVIMAGRKELPTGSGYCVSTFWSALWSLDRSQSFVSTVRLVVSLGGDTDTLACVAGGISSMAYGLASAPDSWWNALVMPEESRDLLDRIRDGATALLATPIAFSVKDTMPKANAPLASKGHVAECSADQALAGAMKPNLVSDLIQRGALPCTDSAS